MSDLHMSDCAVHNEPAFPKGHCDCGVDIMDEAKGFVAGMANDCLSDYENGLLPKEDFGEYLADYFVTLSGNHFRVKIERLEGK